MDSGISSPKKPTIHVRNWLPLSIMDRYLVKELILPFLFGLGLFTSLGVSVGSVFELIRQVTESGLSLGTAIQVLLLNLPQFVAYAMPMSALLATLMTYSRLSSDSELVALRSCGVSIGRLVLPAIVLSFLVTGLNFAFNEMVVPAANYQASLTLDAALNEDKPPFRDQNIVFQEFDNIRQPDGDKQDVLTRFFYAKEFDGERMKGVTYLDFSRQEVSQIAIAESAIWNQDDNVWDFFNGTIYMVSENGEFRNIVKFEQQQLTLPRTPLDLAERGRDYGEMNIAQSNDRLRLIEQTGDDYQIRKLKVRIQQKWALPFACVSLGMVGAVLGTSPRKTGRATSFAISVLMIFGYYLLASVSGAIAQSGSLSPFLGAWIPNFVGLILASLLLVRASR
jgi:lipopolysaccharide export system permease protein